MTMTHPGMPLEWGLVVCSTMLLIGLWALSSGATVPGTARRWRIDEVPLLGRLVRYVTTTPWILLTLRLIAVALFLLDHRHLLSRFRLVQRLSLGCHRQLAGETPLVATRR